MIDLTGIWEKVQPRIKEKVGATSYDTWFSSLNVRTKEPDTLIIETPDEFFQNWILEHYLTVIQEAVSTYSPDLVKIDITVNAQILTSANSPSLPTTHPGTPKKDHNELNPKFSFDNFVIGSSNRFACAAALAVAESPAKAYNPLFIYGQVGLGKTHLMQAIAHQIKHNHHELNYLYLSSEKFTNELIEAIRHRSTSQFRQKYRNIDVLMIDDIHFIAGKESTQEEFFHTFNTLHNNRKQIIISSDRPPKDIANLEERLSSRFTWGLITDIQPPDYETRVAILRKKIEREPVDVPDSVIDFIAEQIHSNIRELEGALIRVVAYSLLEENTISLDMAKSVLKDMVKETIKTIDINQVQRHVSEFFKITVSDLKAKSRHRNILLPRQVAMYLSRQLTTFSLPEIGSAFGGKDHTTVLHSCRKIEKSLANDTSLRRTIERLSTELQQ